MKNIKIIKKWSQLRHPDPNFYKVAVSLYNSLPPNDKGKMITEFEDYIKAVESGTITPELPKIPIRKFKNDLSS